MDTSEFGLVIEEYDSYYVPRNAHAPHVRVDESHPKNSTETPDGLLIQIIRELTLREFDVDLAANDENFKVSRYITESMDSLSQKWSNLSSLWPDLNDQDLLCWLNPPYSNVRPWAEKCVKETWNNPNLTVWMLVHAAPDAKWWLDNVEDKAELCLWLVPRVKFVGHKNTFPKTLCLLRYCDTNNNTKTRYRSWKWK